MTDPATPKRRLWSRSANRSIIVEAGDVTVRVGRETQRTVRRLVLGAVLKYGLPAVAAGAAALAAWRC